MKHADDDLKQARDGYDDEGAVQLQKGHESMRCHMRSDFQFHTAWRSCSMAVLQL